MLERRLNRGLALLLTLCLMITAAIAFAEDDKAQMEAYWRIVGNTDQTDPLTRAMNSAYDTLTLDELKAVTTDDVLTFAAGNKLPVGMARWAWYSALAKVLVREKFPAMQAETAQTLNLFLRMTENPRDKAENDQRRALRRTLTEADLTAYALETGLPAGFLAWLLLDDEWYEADWEDGDDWREGRRDWVVDGWVDAGDLREKYGRETVVTEDDVERVLRQNGYRLDD